MNGEIVDYLKGIETQFWLFQTRTDPLTVDYLKGIETDAMVLITNQKYWIVD